MGATNVWTQTIDGSSINILGSENVQRVSVICSSGVVQIQGSIVYKGLSSTPVELSVGQGITIATKNDSTPIDGLLINAASGIADIILTFQ
jgi:hypothetical protein